MKQVFLTLICLSIIIFFTSCEKESNGSTSSYHNDKDSHNMGQDCMICHIKGGSAKYWFTMSGTVYDSLKSNTFPNSTIELYTGSFGSGVKVGALEVDGYGNFFSTTSIDYSVGLYPSVIGLKDTLYMTVRTENGNCFTCHGESKNRIWAK